MALHGWLPGSVSELQFPMPEKILPTVGVGPFEKTKFHEASYKLYEFSFS
jgi:hypothetical protein